MQKRPLLGLTLSELQNVVKNLGMPGFSAKQIASWLYDKKDFYRRDEQSFVETSGIAERNL